MTNEALIIKLEQRLNKLDSNDYDNIECWQKTEAFNKAQLEWCRRQLHGTNIYKEGDEMSKRRIDDLQILLKEQTLTGTSQDNYFEGTNFPADYLEFKRISTDATNDCCLEPRSMTVYLAEEANVNLLLRDPLKNPDFDWGETFFTFIGNKIRIYKKDFNIVNPAITYYRKPKYIKVIGCQDPNTGLTSAVNIECEFKDDIVEILIDEAASIIARDIEHYNKTQISQQAAERNN